MENLDVTMSPKRFRKELESGDKIIRGRYEVLEKLGVGAMGMVFKCRDTVSGVCYALKMVPSELAMDTDLMEDIRANFQLVHDLKHPNIASYDFLEQDEYGSYFFLIEFVDGINLSRWNKRHLGEDCVDAKLQIIAQLASALDYAHKRKILHRDVKPANIMIAADGTVKLLDFGLASQVRTSMSMISMQAIQSSTGTPNYMAPECFKGQYPRPATDQYALATVAYEMLSGHLPFCAESLDILERAVLNSEPERLDGAPESASRAILKALSKNPQDRFASCGEFAAALIQNNAGAISGGKPSAEPVKDTATSDQEGTSKSWILRPIFVLSLIMAVLFGSIYIGIEKLENYTGAVSQKVPPKPIDLRGNSALLELSGGVSLELLKIEAGTFTMGRNDGENASDEKEHRVTLTRDFYLGRTEVTQGQWKAVMRSNPSHFKKGDAYPVERVSWNDAMSFCDRLNAGGYAPSGWRFTLPTEAQWEYAATDGKNGRGYKYSGSNDCGAVAWYEENSGGATHPVGMKAANELGFHDMSGNVWEWCLDKCGYDGIVSDAYSKKACKDPCGNGSFHVRRVRRGGGWDSRARGCRSARRYGDSPDNSYDFLGFRVALVLVQ